MEQGWSLKKLHKAIMLSHVYQESSQTNPKFETIEMICRKVKKAGDRAEFADLDAIAKRVKRAEKK